MDNATNSPGHDDGGAPAFLTDPMIVQRVRGCEALVAELASALSIVAGKLGQLAAEIERAPEPGEHDA